MYNFLYLILFIHCTVRSKRAISPSEGHLEKGIANKTPLKFTQQELWFSKGVGHRDKPLGTEYRERLGNCRICGNIFLLRNILMNHHGNNFFDKWYKFYPINKMTVRACGNIWLLQLLNKLLKGRVYPQNKIKKTLFTHPHITCSIPGTLTLQISCKHEYSAENFYFNSSQNRRTSFWLIMVTTCWYVFKNPNDNIVHY